MMSNSVLAAHSVTNPGTTGALLLHRVIFSPPAFFQEEKWLSFKRGESEHQGSWAYDFSLLHSFCNKNLWNCFILLMRQIISWLELDVGTFFYGPPLASCIWHFKIPQTMGISFNSIRHWHLTQFTKHYKGSLFLCFLVCWELTVSLLEGSTLTTIWGWGKVSYNSWCC